MENTIVVSGFGRCGSSLVMQMLAVAGLNCAGEWPAYEPDEVKQGFEGCIDLDYILKHDAIKVLDPHVCKLPPHKYKAIWLNRSGEQQARSQIKFINIVAGIPVPNDSNTRNSFKHSYLTDKPKALAALIQAGAREILELHFEQLIDNPFTAAERIAAFVGLDPSVVRHMANAAHPRCSNASPDMSMEISLINEGMPFPHPDYNTVVESSK